MMLPEAGEVFAWAVTQALEVLLWTLAVEEGAACVVMTTVSGRPPLRRARLPASFELQALDHHGWARPILGAWVQQAPPGEVRSLGVVDPPKAQVSRVLHPKRWLAMRRPSKAMAGRVLSLAQWPLLLRDVRAQWRWDHERAAVLAEDQRAQTERATRLFAAAAEHRAQQVALVRSGLPGLKKKRFFQAWRGSVPRALQQDAEALMKQAILELEGAPVSTCARRLSKLVRAFNRLDGAHEHAFDTADAEDIMEAIGTVAQACGVDDETFDARIDAVREF